MKKILILSGFIGSVAQASTTPTIYPDGQEKYKNPQTIAHLFTETYKKHKLWLEIDDDTPIDHAFASNLTEASLCDLEILLKGFVNNLLSHNYAKRKPHCIWAIMNKIKEKNPETPFCLIQNGDNGDFYFDQD